MITPMLVYLNSMNVILLFRFLDKALLAYTQFFGSVFHCSFSLFVEKQGFLII